MTTSSASETSSGCNGPSTIFCNAAIHTVNPAQPSASVMAVRQGIIAYAGTSLSEACRHVPKGTPHVDLAKATVIPGIIEGHMHFLTEGRNLSDVCVSLPSKEAVLDCIAREAAAKDEGTWITGRGWDHERWPGGAWPSKEELDAVSLRHPVALTRMDGHSMWVNSLALRAAGLDAASPDIRGGEIVRTPSGELQGILVDTAMAAVWSAIPDLTERQVRAAYRAAQAELFSMGVTSLVNASQTLRYHDILKNAYEAGEITIRTHEMLAAHKGEDVRYQQRGGAPFEGMYGERLSLRAAKLISDGSLGSRSAWFLEDYADRPGHKGNGRYTDEELAACIRRAGDAGFQICVHAIGDAAARQAVTAMEAALAETPLRDHRWRIEHLQTVTPEDLTRALRCGIIPAMQTIHEVSDRAMAAHRLGPARCAASYNWRGVLDAGGIIVNGSDAPMETVNPFPGFHAAVARLPENKAMTRQEALRSYTIWSAYGVFAEKRKGSLEPGKLADFAVLDRNILTCPQEDLPGTRVLMTVLGGVPVHGG